MREQNLTEFQMVRMVSTLISDELAEAWLYCGLTIVDGYIYYLVQNETYDNFTFWLESFLSNAAGKSFRIIKMIDRMVISSENDDNLLVTYELGVVFGMVMDYEPIIFAMLENISLFKDVIETMKVMARV